jgi:hypothetical protein
MQPGHAHQAVQPTTYRTYAAAAEPPKPPDPPVSHPPDTDLALAAVIRHSKTANSYWDNACSKFTTPDASLLYDITVLSVLQSLGGIAGGYTITHSGKFRHLPAINGTNTGYLAPGMPYTLLSLGHIVRCGGFYKGDVCGKVGTLRVFASGIVEPINTVE